MTETVRFSVAGMTCASCVNRITRALHGLDGVDRIKVDLGRETVTIRRSTAVTNAAIEGAITGAGYTASLASLTTMPDEQDRSVLARILGRWT